MVKKLTFFLGLNLVVHTSTYSQELGTIQSDTDSTSIDYETFNFENYYYYAINQKTKGNHQKAIDALKYALRLNPSSHEAQYELSLNYMALKDVDGAVLYGENAAALNPENKWYWIHLSKIYSAIQNYDKLENCYLQLSKIDSDYKIKYLTLLAQNGKVDKSLSIVDNELKINNDINFVKLKKDILIFQKKYDQALVLLKILLERESLSSYYYDISEIYILKGKESKSERYVDEGLDIFPDDKLLLKQKLRLLVYDNDYKDAFKTLRPILNEDKFDYNDKVQFLFPIVEKEIKQKYFNQFIDILKDWQVQSGDLRVYTIIANLFATRGDGLNAIQTLREAFSKGLTDENALVELLILEQEYNQMDYLELDAKRILEIYPKNPVIYLLKGIAEVSNSKYKESIVTLNYGLNFVENNKALVSEFYGLIAGSYYSLGKIETSFLIYQKSIDANPGNHLILNNFAYHLAEQERDLGKALEMIDVAVTSNPTDDNYLDSKAWILYKKGEIKASLDILKKITDKNPRSAAFLEHYGDVLNADGQFSKALKYWRKAFTINKSETLNKKIKTLE
jgi:tetratricopeptide (TPR) repeat protein